MMAGSKDREYIYGVNPVYLTVTKNAGKRKIYSLYLNSERKPTETITEIKQACQDKKIPILGLDKKLFLDFIRDRVAAGYDTSQGIAAEVSPYNYHSLDHYLDQQITPGSFLVMLDGITDVGNFGSIIRNCAAFGADGLAISKKRSVQVTAKAAKTSAGALEGVEVFRVPNLVGAIKKLKESGFWIYGAEAEKTRSTGIGEAQWNFPLVLVMGSEQKGLSRLVAKNCDYLINVEMTTDMESLNVSVASGIILYRIYREVVR